MGDDAPQNLLQLRLLGGFRADYSGQRVTVANRKCQALLGILSLSEDMTCSRERLRGLLWSEVDEKRAQNNLRQCTHILAEKVFGPLGFEGFHSDRMTLSLDPAQVTCDVLRVKGAIENGEVDDALASNPALFDEMFDGLEMTDPALLQKPCWLYEAPPHLTSYI